MSDDYRVDLKLAGDPAMFNTAARLFLEMGEVPDGPGEDELQRLAEVVDPVLSALLESLGKMAKPPTLDMVMGCTAAEVTLELSVAAAKTQGRDLLGKNADALVAKVEKAFDKVTGPEATTGLAFHLSLTRLIPA